MKNEKITIKTDGLTGHVFIGNKEIHGVRSLDFHIDSEDKIPTLTLNLLAFDTTIEGLVHKTRLIGDGHNILSMELEDGYVRKFYRD